MPQNPLCTVCLNWFKNITAHILETGMDRIRGDICCEVE